MQNQLKAGDEVTYQIGKDKLILTPAPWGKVKKIFKLVGESFKSADQSILDDTKKTIDWAMATIEARMDDMFPLLIDEKRNEFFNKEWIDNNLTIYQIKKIVEDAIVINGVTDFFDKKGGLKVPSAPQPKIPEGTAKAS